MKACFNNLGFFTGGMLNLTGRQAVACLQEGALLVDLREDFEMAIKEFGVPGKMDLPFSQFSVLAETLPRDRPLILADCVGLHSKEAVLQLMKNGYERVANLAGGIAEWERDGLPMKQDIEVMSGQCPCMMKSSKKK